MRAFLALFGLTFCGASFGQTTGVTDQRYSHLARGVNMDDLFQYGSAQVIDANDVTLLENTGFTCIRLPIAPEYILPEFSTPTVINANLANIDATIDLFLNAGIAVMLDFHADSQYLDYYFATPSAPQELIATWQTLATRYANRNPDLLFFEVMNEPDSRFTQAVWDAEQVQVVAAIHAIAPANTVLVTPVEWSGLSALLEMSPYQDPNLIYVLHDYDPLTFTHQGASWVNSAAIESLSNVPYPSYLSALQTLIDQTSDPSAKQLLQQYQSDDWTGATMLWNISLASAWATKWNVRIVANEFGVYKTYSPPDSRARWLHDMVDAFTQYGIGWSMWEYESGFDLVIGPLDGRVIDPNLMPALGFSTWTTPDPPRTTPAPVFTGMRTIQLGGTAVGNGYAEGLVVTDLNNDGLPDLVMTPINYPTLPPFPVQVLYNAGGGIFSPAPFDGAPPTQVFVSSIVPGHFDKSGQMGIFFPDNGPLDNSGAQSKLILPDANHPDASSALRDASGQLPQQVVSTIGGAAGDVNGDGVDDLAVFYSGSNRLPMQLLRNDGTGNFTLDPQAFPSWVSDTSRGDNSFVCGSFVPRPNSPVMDLLAIGWNGTPGRVFQNDGSGKFTVGAILPVPPPNGGPITGGCSIVTDLNGDGKLDVILGFGHAAANQPDVLQFLINNGDGTFHDETDLRIGPLPPSQIGLRRISLVTANHGASKAILLTLVGQTALLYIDHGDGVFVSSQEWNPGATSPWVIAGGDFNGDGLLDIVFGEGGTGATVQAQFGQSAVPADGPAPPAVTHPFAYAALDAAAFSSAVSPGQWMALFGSNFVPAGTAARQWSGGDFQGNQAPTQLLGVGVTIGGKPAAISYASATQLNVQVPDIPTGDYSLIAVINTAGTSTASVFVNAAAPELFVLGRSSLGDLMPAATALDGTLIGDGAMMPGARAAHPGEILVLYGSGFGATNPATPSGILPNPAPLAAACSVLLDGQTITPSFAGISGAGLDQVNFTVPAGLAAGSYTLQVSAGGVLTQSGVKVMVD